jgi:hypothetical protein
MSSDHVKDQLFAPTHATVAPQACPEEDSYREAWHLLRPKPGMPQPRSGEILQPTA